LLHFVSTFEVKTDTKWLVQLARHLAGREFAFHAACFHTPRPIRDQLESAGAKTFDLGVRGECDPRAILRAHRLIRELEPDIVHTHLLRADLLAGLAARWAGTPSIVSTIYAMGEYRRARRRRSDAWLDRACALLPTHWIAVCEAVRQDCIRRQGIDPGRISTIHTGIEPPAAIDPAAARNLRRAWGIDDDQPLVVALARLSYEKGIDTLIEAASLLATVVPTARFVVVGDGPERPALAERINLHGLHDVFRLAGFHDDVWTALAAADVFCLPSHSEGMPNALLEAMIAGRPIVASAVGGVIEAIRSGENGLLAEPGRPASLAAALRAMIEDPVSAARMAESARRTALGRFHVRDVAGRYAAFYRQILMEGENSIVHAAPAH
jgi:glycosyltransferase involved in cell wall biosynthesis